ncbi:MAG: prohibitin family protein [Candidatus Caenarcaniphilales bacterium]|nr:prohibitin family protein [Candidatus Caenarcaniphilales bacterium]
MNSPNLSDFFNPNNPNRGGFDPDDFLNKNKIKLAVILVLIFILPNIVVLVGAGQRAVIFNRVTGMQQRVLEEGIQFVVPLLQQAVIYNVREISYIFSDDDSAERSRNTSAKILGNSIDTLTADGQGISVDVTVRARPDFKELWWLHKELGQDTYKSSYVYKVINPTVRSIVREVIAGYTVSAIYSEDRRVIAEKISKTIETKLSEYKVVLTEFLLDKVTFSDAYQNAIEEKQKARIELDTKDNIIIEKQNERDAIITRAEGEAKAIQLKVNALNRFGSSYVKFKKAQILGKRAKLVIDNDL